MNKVTVLVGIALLAVLAGCAKKEAPQAQQEDEDGGATATEAKPSAAQPVAKDRSKAAADMMAFIDPSPQCQRYRDQLQATGSTVGPIDELNEIFAQAYQNGCGKKKQQKQQ